MFKTIDEYFALQPDVVKDALQRLRNIVKEVCPEAEEVISYRMPAFRYHGMLVGFAGWKNHCSFYPWSGRTIELFSEELKGFSLDKGTIRFSIEKPLPEDLVKMIVKERMRQNLEKEQMKKKQP